MEPGIINIYVLQGQFSKRQSAAYKFDRFFEALSFEVAESVSNQPARGNQHLIG